MKQLSSECVIDGNNANYNEDDLKDHFGVAGVIKDDEGRILMMKHTKFGFWTIPVGKCNDGELRQEGLIRELREELDIEPIDVRWVIRDKEVSHVRNSIPVDVYYNIFEIVTYNGEVKNAEPHKCDGLEWMTLDEIKSLNHISHATKFYLEATE